MIRGFLNGSLSGNLEKTFLDIRDAIRRYIDFTDGRVYDFLACWTVGTYLFPMFSHYPYVHFTGPKGSDKSQCLHVLRTLCHNAKIAGYMTLAVQFRIISAMQPTLHSEVPSKKGQEVVFGLGDDGSAVLLSPQRPSGFFSESRRIRGGSDYERAPQAWQYSGIIPGDFREDSATRGRKIQGMG